MRILNKGIIFCLCVLSMTSCVSKKVYSELEQSNGLLKRQLNKSQQENLTLQSDFNSMKSQMMASNAQKDSDISQAQGLLKKQQMKADDLQLSLDNISKLYSSQKNYGSSKIQEIETLKDKLNDLRATNSSLSYALKEAQNRAETSNNDLNNARQNADNQTTNSRQLQVNNTAQKKEIELLNNQIQENKKLIDDIASTFVALRKDLLTSLSQGKPLNPNDNGNIDKLANYLGQD